VAQEVAKRLGGWLVYDRKLLEKIAEEMGFRTSLLESVDEKRLSWLEESLGGFLSAPSVTTSAFGRQLIRTVLALSAHGECVIVGRGVAFLLPHESTLRVRLVAPLEHRIAIESQRSGISRKEAAARIDKTDRARVQFVRDHFSKDTTDPRHYDLVLNTSVFSVAECADLIAQALKLGQQAAASKNAKKGAES
jgi:cytidylate kinase